MNKYFGLAIIAAIAVSGCGKDEQASEETPAGSTPKSAPAAAATHVEVAVLGDGTAPVRMWRPAEVKGAREANLAAALGGYVEAVKVTSGTDVKKGQVIARVNSSTMAAQRSLALAVVEEAVREGDRLNKLGKAIPAARRDAAATRITQAKAQLRIANINSGRAVIRAPFSGTLVGFHLERGEVLAPGFPIGRLVQLDPIVVSASVTDRDIASLKVGQDALVISSAAATPRPGKISKIEPSADINTRTFLVEVSLANPGKRMLPGMVASVEFRRQLDADVRLLPQDLVVTTLGGNGVFVAEGGVAKWRPLELGEVVGDQVSVKSGLATGDRLVVVGHRGLSDGDPLIVGREGVCCAAGRPVFESAPSVGSGDNTHAAAPSNAAAAQAKASPASGSKPREATR